MEISSHYTYHAKMLPEGEDQKTVSGNGVRPRGSEPARETPTVDSLTLVQTQNLASPVPQELNLQRAAELLQQVQEQLQVLNKDQAGDLYQVNRLREVLYRMSAQDPR